MSWIAERHAVNPSNEENAAMAYMKSGTQKSRASARDALIEMVRREIASWERMGMDSTRERNILLTLQTSNVDKVESGGIRWSIREI